MECTLNTCAQPTDLNLCSDCTRDLQAILDKIPALIPVLDLIGRKVEQAFTTRTSNRPAGKAKPQTPLNLSAVALATKLRMAGERNANDYAHDDDAAWKFEHIEQSVRDADRMVNGEEESTRTDEYILDQIKKIPPMPSKLMAEYLQEKLGLNITDGRIRKWASRHELQRANNDSKNPLYRAEDVLARYTGNETMRSIKERATQ